jgi:hypothetical protein
MARASRLPADPPESTVTGSQIRAGWGRSAARCELVAGGRAADRPPDQATAAECKWRKHVLAAVAADLGLRGGPVVRRLLRETPYPCCHPIPPESDRTSGLGGTLEGGSLLAACLARIERLLRLARRRPFRKRSADRRCFATLPVAYTRPIKNVMTATPMNQRRTNVARESRRSSDFPQSGRPDLNRGPPVPQTGALTRLRHAPYPAEFSYPRMRL